MTIFLNGRFVPENEAVVPINDRGFMYGDGLFETVRIMNRRPFRLAQHLERMIRGADFLKIKPPFAPRKFRGFEEKLIEQKEMREAFWRVPLPRGRGGRVYRRGGGDTPTV